ncbi:MAG TPA: DbpA RNA binding domain-containing protein, partial [Devosia sp.]
PADAGKPPRRDKRFADEGTRAPDLSDGVWFSLSLGRKHRADPKWLLPLLCKAGNVEKRDIGSIRIFDADTRFEIAADKAAAFAEAVAQPGALEKGARIVPVSEKLTRSGKPFSRPRTGKPYAPAEAPSEKPKKWQPRLDHEPRPEREQKYKVRSDKGAGLGTQPATGLVKAPKSNPKDKGKPKYRNRPNAGKHQGEQPRKKSKQQE